MLPSGGLFSYGTELIPLFPYLRAGLSKVGGNFIIAAGNRMRVTNYGLIKGLPDFKVNPGLEKILLVCL